MLWHTQTPSWAYFVSFFFPLFALAYFHVSLSSSTSFLSRLVVVVAAVGILMAARQRVREMRYVLSLSKRPQEGGAT